MEEKDCNDCKNFPSNLCLDCKNYNRFESIEEKDCINCKHYFKDLYEYPCTCCKYHKGTEDRWEPEETQDNVILPDHYGVFQIRTEDIIKFVLTEEQFKGFCLGNEIKYRLRAGIKDPDKIIEDISKAEKYREWRNKCND